MNPLVRFDNDCEEQTIFLFNKQSSIPKQHTVPYALVSSGVDNTNSFLKYFSQNILAFFCLFCWGFQEGSLIPS